MDPRMLRYYNRELQHLREMGGEFATEFPKIAGRLGLDGFECADPYVERLLEGFAFLAARVQLKIDAEFPAFTQHLLDRVYPHYLAPVPSMAVVEFHPDLSEGALAEGFLIPRNSSLRSLLGKDEQTACEYRTAHDVTLWPLEMTDAQYFSRESAPVDVPAVAGSKAGIRWRFRTTAGLNVDALTLDRLPIFLRGSGQLAMRLYEQLLGSAVAVIVRSARRPSTWQHIMEPAGIGRVGFEDRQALLPYGPVSFQGYRLIQEYFAFPNRFMFIELTGLQPAISQCRENELEIIVLFSKTEAPLENALDASDFGLFCTPAINLFPKRADRVHLDRGKSEFHIVPDRTRPMDFEVHSVNQVLGHGTNAEEEQEFLPFYAVNDLTSYGDHHAYYALRRQPRVLSARQKLYGPRSSYIGSESFVSLVDSQEAPYRHQLRQLSFQTLCTNRDLPLHMPVAKGPTDFTMESGAPVRSVRCVAGPTKPKPPLGYAAGETAWRLISHLSLNYLSLMDQDERQGASALRDLLKLYADTSEAPIQQQLEGIRSISSTPVMRRIPTTGPMAFGRGQQITVICEESSFEGSGVFLLGAVLECFFAKYVSINSFTETVITTVDRGEVMRWPIRIGRRHTI